MAERDTSRDIDQAASDWAARLDRGPLSPHEEEAFQTWLQDDPRSKGALLRAQAISMMSESARALGPGFEPAAFEWPRRSWLSSLSRRQALTWTGGAAIAAASLTAFGLSLPAAGAVIETGKGEIRLVPLKDGSTVLLNTDSRIRIRYGESERFVTLLQGEAYFSVAPDGKRPFVVEVEGRRLHTAQAQFRVRKLERAPVDILVQQGQLHLPSADRMASAGTVALGPNMRLTLPDGTGGGLEQPKVIAPEIVTRELAWREGKLAFEGETLETAAASFARYSDKRILIRDQGLAREPVTGLFAANDPVGFSRAIAHVFDARLRQEGGDIVLSRGEAAE